MAESGPKKIVYLFGAGATHAELENVILDLVPEQVGLLISQVSTRVIEKARRDDSYLKDMDTVTATKGSLNIELLISLIENSKVNGWEKKSQRLKELVQQDIEAVLAKYRRRFYLHKALFELHDQAKVKAKERVIGCISLNYDDVLDVAYQKYLGTPNYCISLRQTSTSEHIPLLKLHGSFKWQDQKVWERIRTIEIIPLGSNKSYLHAPYNAIWNRAMEVLIRCNTLRVIGCSLSQNDVHLIDLLFKAHLERREAFDIELISPQESGDQIQYNYGFFPQIKTLREIEGHLIPAPNPPNPFKTWLKYKVRSILGDNPNGTEYLSTLLN